MFTLKIKTDNAAFDPDRTGRIPCPVFDD